MAQPPRQRPLHLSVTRAAGFSTQQAVAMRLASTASVNSVRSLKLRERVFGRLAIAFLGEPSAQLESYLR